MLIALPSQITIDFSLIKNTLTPVSQPLAQRLPPKWQWEKPLIQTQTFTSDLPFVFGLDIQGGTQVTLAADITALPEADRQAAMDSAQEVLRRRLDLYGISETSIRGSVLNGQYQILVEIPGVDQPGAALELIGQTAKLQFREAGAETLALQTAAVASPSAAQAYIESFLPTELDGTKLERATISFHPQTQEPSISLKFTPEGSVLFTTLTERNLNKPLAIFLDENPLSFPVVSETIYGGEAALSGGFTLEQAKALAAQLNAGALPLSLEVVQQETIGPSLGQASLQQSLVAGLVGLALVMCFMVLIYGWGGVIANIGLLAYSVLTLALYKLLPVTLTLPGIAGLVLSIGMAVDANILTLERIKEEVRSGKNWSVALNRGFGRSWESIKGANIATLMVCAILFNPLDWGWLHTSGPVRGFSLTLALGIGVSLLSGVFFSRILMKLFLAPPKHLEDPL